MLLACQQKNLQLSMGKTERKIGVASADLGEKVGRVHRRMDSWHSSPVVVALLWRRGIRCWVLRDVD